MPINHLCMLLEDREYMKSLTDLQRQRLIESIPFIEEEHLLISRKLREGRPGGESGNIFNLNDSN